MDSDDEISAFAPSPSRRRSGLPLGFRVIVAVVALLTLLVAVAVVAIVLLAGVDHAARAGEHATPYGNAVSTAALTVKGAEQSSASSLSDRSNDSLWVLLVCLGVALATAIPIGLWLVRSIAVPVYRLLSILNFDGASGMPSL